MDNLFRTFFNLINTTRWDVKDVTNRDQCFDLVTGWAKMLGLPDTIFNGILYAKNLTDHLMFQAVHGLFLP